MFFPYSVDIRRSTRSHISGNRGYDSNRVRLAISSSIFYSQKSVIHQVFIYERERERERDTEREMLCMYELPS